MQPSWKRITAKEVTSKPASQLRQTRWCIASQCEVHKHMRFSHLCPCRAWQVACWGLEISPVVFVVEIACGVLILADYLLGTLGCSGLLASSKSEPRGPFDSFCIKLNTGFHPHCRLLPPRFLLINLQLKGPHRVVELYTCQES